MIRKNAPWMPFNLDGQSADGTKNLPKAVAVQALAEGKASAYQQKLALQCIVEDLCEYHGLSYSPDNTHDTAFAEGKRWVAAQIVKLTRINYNEARKRNE